MGNGAAWKKSFGWVGASSFILGSLAVLTLELSLLVTQSSAFVAVPVLQPYGSTNMRIASHASHHQLSSNSGDRGRVLLDSPFLPSRSCKSHFSNMGHGGRQKLPLAMLGSGVSAAALDMLRSASATVPLGGPALFAQGLGLSLLLSADGFRVREHFVSYGYGFSVAAQAAIAMWLFRHGLHALPALHAAGLIAYGLRLAAFCRWRDTMESFQEMRRCYQQQSRRLGTDKVQPTGSCLYRRSYREPNRAHVEVLLYLQSKHLLVQLSAPRPGLPFTFWAICGQLYAFLALPTVYALRRLPSAQGRFVGVAPCGLGVMWIGLVLEGIADWQKTTFKKTQPTRFCDRGLYRFCRHPNYLGEAVFWGGVWLAAVPSFTSWYHWILGSLGPLQIVSIILRATGGLEKRQVEKYGSSAEFKAYAASTPVLVPGTRQFEWK